MSPVYDDGQTDDSGYWVYDYASIAPYVDAISVMAYDYSVAEPGPIAPLPWVEELMAGSTGPRPEDRRSSSSASPFMGATG